MLLRSTNSSGLCIRSCDEFLHASDLESNLSWWKMTPRSAMLICSIASTGLGPR